MNLRFNFKKFLLLTAVILLSAVSTYAFSLKNMTLNFIQFSDTHISERQDRAHKVLNSSKDLLIDAIKEVNSIKPLDFVIFTGDMVDTPTQKNYDDFFAIVADLKYPYLNTFGNHDSAVCLKSNGKCTKGLLKDEALALVKSKNLNYVFDKSYYSFTPKTDFHIIVLDNVISDEITSTGFTPDEQLLFLDSELSKHKDKVVLIFQHHPVVQPFISDDHRIINADKYLEILRKYNNPIAVFAGHYHTSDIKTEGNLVFVASPSLVTYPNAFRHVEVINYSDKTVFDFNFHETKLKEVQMKAKGGTIAAATFYGEKKDRTFTYTVDKKVKKKSKKRGRSQEVTESVEQ